MTEQGERGELLTTALAAKQLGISSRTLVRYAELGYVAPALTLPSGHRRWNLAALRRQLEEHADRDD